MNKTGHSLAINIKSVHFPGTDKKRKTKNPELLPLRNESSETKEQFEDFSIMFFDGVYICR